VNRSAPENSFLVSPATGRGKPVSHILGLLSFEGEEARTFGTSSLRMQSGGCGNQWGPRYNYLQLRDVRSMQFVDESADSPRMMVATAGSSIVSIFLGQKYQRSWRLSGRADQSGHSDSGGMWHDTGRFRGTPRSLLVVRPPALLGRRAPRFPERAADVDELTLFLLLTLFPTLFESCI
jgi:hypothetical protein